MQLFYKNKNLFFILLIFIALTSLIFYFLVRTNFIIWGNDLMGNTSYLVFVKNSLLDRHVFPQWNFYYGSGIPAAGDPLNSIYNPFVLIIFLLFPYLMSIELVYYLCIFFSCISMYLLSRYFKLQKIISVIISLTYATSGYLVARLIAGHWEKIIAYPLIPLFYLVLIKLYRKPNLLLSGTLALIISLLIFSASIYEAFYAVLILFLMSIYILLRIIFKHNLKKDLRKIFYLLLSVFFIPFFSAIKTFPMLQINQTLSRPYDPFLGSQNIFTLIYNFFIPSPYIVKLLAIGKYINFPYIWFESFAFVGPFFFFGLIISLCLWKKNLKDDSLILGFILIMLFLFSMLAYKWNPYYWLFQLIPALREFRIPSRIFIYAIPLIILLGSAGINYYYLKTKHQLIKILILLMLILNFLLTADVFIQYIYANHLPNVNPNSSFLLSYLKKRDKTVFYVAQSVLFENQILAYDAVYNNQIILDPNYGWAIANPLTGNYGNIDFTGTGEYQGIYPKYFIYRNGQSPPRNFNIKLLKTVGGISLYKNSLFTPFAYTAATFNKLDVTAKDDPDIKSVIMEPNRIEILARSSINRKLIVAENNFPGWSLSIDNKKQPIRKNYFLTADMKSGLHKYVFQFSSSYADLGCFVTIFSLLIWVIAIKFGRQMGKC